MLCLRADRQKEALDAYLMSGVRRIVYKLMGRDADMPGYFEYAENIRFGRANRLRADRRSAAQIKADILEKLGV